MNMKKITLIGAVVFIAIAAFAATPQVKNV